MKNIYLAGPFFNEEQLNFIKALENALKDYDVFSPRSEGTLINMSQEEKEKALNKIFKSNVSNIKDCDIVVAVIDDWDTGTVWECGAAYIAGKPIFTISNKDYGLNVMVRQSVACHNKSIDNMLVNIDQFIKGIKMTQFDELTKDVT